MSPMLRAKQAEVTAEAAKAEVQEAPKRATALQTEALKATATSKDKQLGNLTRLKYAQILGDARFKASFATLGVKMNEVHLHPSQIGQPQFMDKFGQLYTYEAAKSDGKHSSAAGWVLTDMSNVTPPANYTMPQQVAGADASAAADSPSDAYPEGE